MVISQVGPKTKARLRVFSRALFRTRTGDPLLTMRSNRQPVATDGDGFGLFLPFPRRFDLPLIATGCNHGAPSRLHPLLSILTTQGYRITGCLPYNIRAI